MKLKLKLMLAFAVGAVPGVIAGCQQYDFEPVDPLAISQTTQPYTVVAKQFKPDLMFLIDKSGSMAFPTDTGNGNCPAGCGPDGSGGSTCPPACPTRISELRVAMDGFLMNNGGIARMGMAIFPAASGTGNTVIPNVAGTGVQGCGPTTSNEVLVELSQSKDIDAELKMSAADVNNAIQALKVGGGTPTADSLRYLGTYSKLNDPDREDFIVLLTDGLPNCNGYNKSSCTAMPMCLCTIGTSQASCNTAQFCQAGCLDSDNSVDAIVELRKKFIRTIVVGFGADTASGPGPIALNAMAEAGGFARGCPDAGDGACGGAVGSCDKATALCKTRFYQATTSGDLTKALNDIANSIINTTPCIFTLADQPSDPRFLSVIVDGVTIPPNDPTGGWDYSGGKVTFKPGKQCDALTNATLKTPVQVEFRIVKSL